MKKIIYLFTATLVFSVQGVAMAAAAELVESIDNGDLQELKQEVCNNSQVQQLLATNALDEILYVETTSGTITYGGGGDDDGGGSTTYNVNNSAPPTVSSYDSINLLCS